MSWNSSTLGCLIEHDGGLIQTGPFGSQLHRSDYVTKGIPVIMPKDIAGGCIDEDSVARVSEETVRRLSRHKVCRSTIVLPRRGEITKRAFIRDEQSGWLCGTGCLQIVLSGKKLLPEFLYYYMEQQGVDRWLEQHAVGTTMLNLSGKIVAELPVRYPSLGYQQRIVSILSAYDDLIENNRRRIQLLEHAARLLYREWFVHLRFPGHEHVKIKDGVPEGWERKPLEELATFNKQSIKKGFQGVIEYIDIASVSPGTINGSTTLDFAKAPSRARRIVSHGDIIWSCVRPNRKSFSIIWEPVPNLIVSTGFVVITPRQSILMPFIYFSTTTQEYVDYLSNVATGAAYPAVKPEDFKKSLLLVPPDIIITELSNFCCNIFKQLKILQQQNKKLAQARDLLLPRLMNGEIAV